MGGLLTAMPMVMYAGVNAQPPKLQGGPGKFILLSAQQARAVLRSVQMDRIYLSYALMDGTALQILHYLEAQIRAGVLQKLPEIVVCGTYQAAVLHREVNRLTTLVAEQTCGCTT